ncbi:MAG: hypothetical protein MI806_05420 [Minwuiales bacterium]|nr:hypothetical protein [Minwuiales bacterium]
MSEVLGELSSRDLLRKVVTDEDGTVRDAALARIKDKAAEIKKRLDDGLSPAEYQVLGKAHEALEISAQVVSKVWSLAKIQRERKGD